MWHSQEKLKSLPIAVTQAKLKQGETVFHCKNKLLALKWMDKREVYIPSGLHKATNVISKKTNYKGQKVNKPQPVFLYNRYMSGVDLTDQFLQYYSFLHKSVKWSKEILCALLEYGYTQCTYSPQEIFRQQNNALAVQDTTSKAHVE